MASEIQKKILITGFGPFGEVINNPTSDLIKSLTVKEKEDLNIIDTDVVEVSVKGVEMYYERLNKQSVQIDQNCIFIHLGVKSDINKIDLEQCSYNNANFRIPDYQGYQPLNKKIVDEQELDQCSTSIVDCSSLIQNNEFLQQNCKISTNPGRFLSVYPDIPSVFVHVPHFYLMDQQKQKETIMQLINQLQTVK